MKRRTKYHNKTGFTLVEILVTVAVVAILLGLLIPALSSVEDLALKVKQRAQLHSIEVALEGFSEGRDYPPSTWNLTTYGNYSASQRLAEALVGRDGFGFHPDSQFNENGEDAAGTSLYMTHANFSTDYPTQTEIDNNLAVRKGPYLELENANAVKLSNLYGAGNYGSLVDTFVFSDMYKVTKNLATGKMTGSPILYYRADRTKYLYTLTGMPNLKTYSVFDSLGGSSPPYAGIASLDPLDKTKSGQKHPILNDWQVFYGQTQNPNFTSPERPYRADSFILQSAGPDSLYGTADDVFNFDREY